MIEIIDSCERVRHDTSADSVFDEHSFRVGALPVTNKTIVLSKRYHV